MELESTSVRWYQDSDVGRKLSGKATIGMSGDTLTYSQSTAITTSPTEVAAVGNDFVYIKNTGSSDILVTLDNVNYLILLSQNETFSSKIDTAANVKVKTSSGTSTIETLVGT